jgi:plastocyanin
MSRTRIGLTAVVLFVACATAVALLGATASAAKPKPAQVSVNDFYFGPSSVTIKKGGSVKWTWSATNAYPHDVHLKSGPKGLKQKSSYSTKTTAVSEAEFKKSFPTPGTYKFICTIHPTEMKLTVVVKK